MMHACSQYVHTHTLRQRVCHDSQRGSKTVMWYQIADKHAQRTSPWDFTSVQRKCVSEVVCACVSARLELRRWQEKNHTVLRLLREACLSHWTQPPLNCLHASTNTHWHTQAHSWRLSGTGSCSVRHHSVTPLILSYFQNTKCSDPICGAKFKLHNLMRLLFLLCFIMSRSKLRWSSCICCKASHSNDKNIVFNVQLILKPIFHRENKGMKPVLECCVFVFLCDMLNETNCNSLCVW